ncbi:MAG: DUF4476 domain-containing protein [Bacteroidales bacterium]|nr:DUF4476 domain-containing protein [Bacteroidales bacterium]
MGLLSAIVRAITNSSSKKIISIHSTEGIKFWVYLDNILQNQHSESSISIIEIPVDEDAKSLLEVTVDYGNGNIAKSKAEKVVLTSTHKYYTLKIEKKKISLKSTRAFEVAVEEKCKGVKPEYDDDDEDIKPAVRKAQTNKAIAEARAATAAANKAAKAANAAAASAMNKTDGFCTDRQFKNILKEVYEHSFDDDKVVVIKKHVAKKNLHVSQLIELVEQLTYDDSRLEVLLFAYPYCKEKRHYRETLSSLTYYDSREKVEEMITKRKR